MVENCKPNVCVCVCVCEANVEKGELVDSERTYEGWRGVGG